jgi:hypothetical protein
MSMSQPMGGQNRTTHQEATSRLRERFDWLESFTDDELGEIVFLRGGETTRSDEVYFDISDPERGEFQGMDGELVPEDSRYVPKSQVPQYVWDKLVGPYQ